MDYITWCCDHGFAPETFLVDVFLNRSTKPSGKPGGKPRGEYTTRKGKPFEAQNHAADILADEGYDVKMLKEEHRVIDGITIENGNGYGFDPKSNPDFLIGDKVFDVYAPEGQKLKNIKNSIQEKTTRQTDNIIIATENYTEDVGELKNFLLGQTKYDLKHLRELKAIVNGKVETWFVR